MQQDSPRKRFCTGLEISTTNSRNGEKASRPSFSLKLISMYRILQLIITLHFSPWHTSIVSTAFIECLFLSTTGPAVSLELLKEKSLLILEYFRPVQYVSMRLGRPFGSSDSSRKEITGSFGMFCTPLPREYSLTSSGSYYPFWCLPSLHYSPTSFKTQPIPDPVPISK